MDEAEEVGPIDPGNEKHWPPAVFLSAAASPTVLDESMTFIDF